MALSYESPLEPTEVMTVDSAKACPYLIDRNCTPRSLWCTRPATSSPSLYFLAKAIIKTSLANDYRIWLMTCQPTISRVNTSRMNIE